MGAGGQIVDRSLGHDAPSIHDDGPLTDVLDEVELMEEKITVAASLCLADENPGQHLDSDGIQP